MWTDIVDLRDFYAASRGQVAGRLIRRRVRELWPDLSGFGVLGIGYATPYLQPFRDEAARIAAVMPAAQGALRWPREGAGLVALGDEAELPLPDLSFERVLLVHALECSEQSRALLREIWRVMTDDGRLLVIVPNRRGLWARQSHTPFGQGRPFSPAQLSRLLRENMFVPLRPAAALYVPPSRSRMLLSAAPAWEKIGRRWFPGFGGVIMGEAGKQIYGAATVNARRRARRYAALGQSAATLSIVE